MIEYLNRWNSIIIFNPNEKDYVAVNSGPWPVNFSARFIFQFIRSGLARSDHVRSGPALEDTVYCLSQMVKRGCGGVNLGKFLELYFAVGKF
jgi:hypothetical protein